MKVFARALGLGIAVIGSLAACRSKEAPPSGAASATAEAAGSVAASGEAAAKFSLAAPRIGGSVTAAGDHSVELKLHRSGAVEALVSNAAGEMVGDDATLA